jgi:hypothetical protein
MAEMPSDALRTVTPEQDLLLHINDTYAGRKAFQDVATSVELIEGRHAFGVRVLWGSSARIHRDFSGLEHKKPASL